MGPLTNAVLVVVDWVLWLAIASWFFCWVFGGHELFSPMLALVLGVARFWLVAWFVWRGDLDWRAHRDRILESKTEGTLS